jgi:uncharacterized protein Usg
MTKYPLHGIRAYPKEIKKFTLTKDKICCSFGYTEFKPNGEAQVLPKVGKQGPILPISTKGTGLDHLAVGVHIEDHKVYQRVLLKAYKMYVEEFDPEFKDFLDGWHKELGEMLDSIEIDEENIEEGIVRTVSVK